MFFILWDRRRLLNCVILFFCYFINLNGRFMLISVWFLLFDGSFYFFSKVFISLSSLVLCILNSFLQGNMGWSHPASR